jgi:hypothetical protein
VARQEDPSLILRCNEVAHFTEKASNDENLLQVLELIPKKLRVYAFKYRFKGANSILQKVVRKRREGKRQLERLTAERRQIRSAPSRTPEAAMRLREIRHEIENAREAIAYNPDHVTDALGCRFVTLYQSEIPLTVSVLLAELHAFNERGGGYPVRLKEFVIYTNRPPQDPLSITDLTIEALERSGFKDHASTIREPENRKSAYSSVHLVFDRDVDIQHTGKEPATELAKFEIQIRDIFEEGWGEVQHHLLYSEKERTDFEDGTAEKDDGTGTWRSHLNALKTFVDGCSQHASIIRQHYDDSRRVPIATHVTQSVTDRVEDHRMVIQELKRVGAPQKALEAISNAYTWLRSGEEAQTSVEKISRFEEASESFDAALKLLARKQRNVILPTRLSVHYYLQIEYGNCKMAVAEARGRVKKPGLKRERLCHEAARDAYTDVANLYPNDPVAHIRLGKAQEKLAGSIAELEAAKATIDRGIALIGDDQLTGSDHWIAITSRIDQGFVLWRMAQKQRSESDPIALDLILEAAAANLEALQTWEAQSETVRLREDNRLAAHKAASNLLFFGGKIVEANRETPSINRGTLRRLIAFIPSLAIDTHADFYKTRDNFLHAYRALGDEENARLLAEANFLELRALAEARTGPARDIGSVARALHGSEARCFRTARQFLFRHEG